MSNKMNGSDSNNRSLKGMNNEDDDSNVDGDKNNNKHHHNYLTKYKRK